MQLSFVESTSDDYVNRPPARFYEVKYENQQTNPVGRLYSYNPGYFGNVLPSIFAPQPILHKTLMVFPAFHKALFSVNGYFGQMSRSDAAVMSSFQHIAFHYWVENLAPDETQNNLNGYYISTIGYTNNLSLNYRVVRENTSPNQVRVYVEDPGVVLVYIDAINGNQLPNRVVKLKPRTGYNFYYYSIGNYKFTVIESNQTKTFALAKTTSSKPLNDRALLYITYPYRSPYPPQLFTNGFFLPYFLASTEEEV